MGFNWNSSDSRARSYRSLSKDCTGLVSHSLDWLWDAKLDHTCICISPNFVFEIYLHLLSWVWGGHLLNYCSNLPCIECKFYFLLDSTNIALTLIWCFSQTQRFSFANAGSYNSLEQVIVNSVGKVAENGDMGWINPKMFASKEEADLC